MKLLFNKRAKKTTEYGLPLFAEEKKLRLKARLSLSVIWGCAVLVCILFITFTLLQPEGSYMVKSSLLLKIQTDLLADNDAQAIAARSNNNDVFVFVHLNKKFFLTRFPSGNEDEPERIIGKDGTKTGMINTRETERVIRKIKTPNNPKKYVDFTIKPVPK